MQLLAVDVGGTSTRAAVVERDGTCVGIGRAGSGNPTSSGGAAAVAAIVAAAGAAITQSGARATDLAGGVVAIAGAGADTGAWLLGELAKAGLPDGLTLDADLLAMYLAGSLADDGYALIAGTGAAAIRVRHSSIDATADGLGWLLGDAGSGFWIGHHAVRAAAAGLDRRGPTTLLSELVMTRLGVEPSPERRRHGRVPALTDAVAALYRVRPVELARFAPLVFEAAATGDRVATTIVAAAAEELATSLAAVTAADIDGPLVLGGSVLSRQPALADLVVRSFRDAGHSSSVVTVADGLAGAAVLALRRHGHGTVDDAAFDRIHASLGSAR